MVCLASLTHACGEHFRKQTGCKLVSSFMYNPAASLWENFCKLVRCVASLPEAFLLMVSLLLAWTCLLKHCSKHIFLLQQACILITSSMMIYQRDVRLSMLLVYTPKAHSKHGGWPPYCHNTHVYTTGIHTAGSLAGVAAGLHNYCYLILLLVNTYM